MMDANTETLVPVRTKHGDVVYLPVADDETPTFLIVVNEDKAAFLETSDPNGDRIAVGAVTIAEAVGKVLMDNPRLSYNDILDHMEV